MPSSRSTKTGPRQIASMEMTLRILAKRASHMTNLAIAKEEGVSEAAVRKRILKALENAPKEPTEHLRNVLTEQVRYAMMAITERVGRGELAAIDRWYAGIERISRLHGVDLTPELHIHPPLPQSTLALLETWGSSVEGSYKLLEEPEATLQDAQEGASE